MTLGLMKWQPWWASSPRRVSTSWVGLRITPDHIRAIADAVLQYEPRAIPEIVPACRLSGLEPFMRRRHVRARERGERTNVGSPRLVLIL